MNINNPIDTNPDELADFIFSDQPKPKNSIQLVQHEDNMDIMFIYEVLISVVMEGILHLIKGIDDPSELSLDNLDDVHFQTLNPWIQSMGFNLEVIKTHEKPLHYYCRTIFNNYKDKSYFTTNNLTKHYHFIITSTYSHNNNNFNDISQIKTVVQMNNYWLEIYFSLCEDNNDEDNNDEDNNE
jgi:hypothetical protein